MAQFFVTAGTQSLILGGPVYIQGGMFANLTNQSFTTYFATGTSSTTVVGASVRLKGYSSSSQQLYFYLIYADGNVASSINSFGEAAFTPLISI